MIAVVLLSGIMSCSRRARIIPESKLSQIYAEMFMADEWLRDHSGARRTADTTLFYEPIFNKYGYTTKDYIATVDEYIYKPDDFAKVFEKTKEILAQKAEETRELKDIIDGINEANKSIGGYAARHFVIDSLIWADSSSILWHWPDKILPGVTLPVRDSLLCADSLAVLDSLANLDSLARLDSLAAADSLAKLLNQ